jgi:pyridoxine/pyridoxamine 5'-phosphate oxidase
MLKSDFMNPVLMATSSAEGDLLRVVLLKGFDGRLFLCNYKSRKVKILSIIRLAVFF